jgi:hypothetical protein
MEGVVEARLLKATEFAVQHGATETRRTLGEDTRREWPASARPATPAVCRPKSLLRACSVSPWLRVETVSSVSSAGGYRNVIPIDARQKSTSSMFRKFSSSKPARKYRRSPRMPT